MISPNPFADCFPFERAMLVQDARRKWELERQIEQCQVRYDQIDALSDDEFTDEHGEEQFILETMIRDAQSDIDSLNEDYGIAV